MINKVDENGKAAYDKVVGALHVIGLTLETAEYLREHDPQALKQVDLALEAIGTPVKLLRNRARKMHGEDEDNRLGYTFLTGDIRDGLISARSVEIYIEDFLQSPDGSWEMVFFPHGEPQPTGVTEDYMAMYDADDWVEELDRKERSISPMHLQELDYLDVNTAPGATEAEARMKRISEVMDANARLAEVDNALDEIDQYVQPWKRPSRRSTRPRSG